MPGNKNKKTGRDIITIGASAGGVEAVLTLLDQLSPRINAVLFIVQHIPATPPSILPQLISSRTRWEAVHPRHGQHFQKGKVYVAPSDHHMTISEGRVELDRGPKQNRSRPAVDPLFRSAALTYGPRVIGIILSGSLDDGTAGLKAIKTHGGVAVVQDPKDAVSPGMPRSAIEHVEVDHVVPLARMGALLAKLATAPLKQEKHPAKSEKMENLLVHGKSMTPGQMASLFGAPSGLICPECNGPIWEIKEGKLAQFRCMVGHHFSPESFLAEETESLERALWVAVKTMEERVSLFQRLASQSWEAGHTPIAKNFEKKALECEIHARTLRGMVEKLKT